ncbi:MAG: hypothetical protein ACPGFC_00260, partial [Paracoccaceae bacterium]
DQGGDMAMVASPELPASFPGDASSEPPQKGAQDDLDLPDLEALGGDAPGADAFAAALADEDDDMALDENGLADLDAIAALMEE